MKDLVKVIEIEDSKIISVFDIAKSDPNKTKPEQLLLPLSVPATTTPKKEITQRKTIPAQQTYWHIEMQPRDWHGRWSHTGKAHKPIEKIFEKQTQAITRIKTGSIVMVKDPIKGTGQIAKVLDVPEPGKYQIQIIKEKPEIMTVTKEEISKQLKNADS